MRDYYLRRATDGVGLILTEGIVIHLLGDGYNRVPHIWEKAQADSWKETIAAVHAADSKIVAQLWHCGRISHEDYTGGARPVSSTDRAANGINRQNGKPYSKPRRLCNDEVKDLIAMYRHSARLCLDAGFDAVELHLGHGYLADQFFDARINDREDEYGGSVENRCRFPLELIKDIVSEFGSHKVIVRISPSRDMGGIYDWPDLDRMLEYFTDESAAAGLRMLDVSCARADYFQTSGRVLRLLRKHWDHETMGGASLSKAQASAEIDQGNLSMVTWGRHILANPDFVSRLEEDRPLVEYLPAMQDTLY